MITKIADKKYVGKNIICKCLEENDRHMIYNVAYLDGKTGYTFVKRFPVTSMIIDKTYNIVK